MRLWRFIRFLGKCAVFCFIIWALGLLAFLLIARRCQPDFKPISEPPSVAQLKALDKITNYKRHEESTYLTFPEWYLVFNPQEYGQWLHSRPPSEFPYFSSIAQFWQSYGQVYGITHRAYPFNGGNHLMEIVIGTSFTVEYLFKGVYENTLGRVGEWASGGERTDEDDYAARIAEEYGAFVPTQPWFEYPFGHAFVGLWKENAFFGKHFGRKIERKFFLTLEYGAKTVYAAVLRAASRSVFGVADEGVLLLASNVTPQVLAIPHVRELQKLSGTTSVLAVPHYQGFTDTAPLLARSGMRFINIAGADEILVTVIAPKVRPLQLDGGTALFVQPLYIDDSSQRVAFQVPVRTLSSFLLEADKAGVRIEHLFDY